MAVETKLLAEVKKILQGFGEQYLTSTGKLKRSKLIADLDAYLPILKREIHKFQAKFFLSENRKTIIE